MALDDFRFPAAKPVTDELRREVIDRFERGEPVALIARETSTRDSIIRRIVCGRSRNVRKQPPEYLPALIDLMLGGMSMAQAAGIVGRRVSTCWEAINRYAPDLPRQTKPRITAAERREIAERFERGESILSISLDTGRTWRAVERAAWQAETSLDAIDPLRCPSCGAMITTVACVRCRPEMFEP